MAFHVSFPSTMSAYDSSSTGSPGFVSKSPSPSRPDWLAGSLVAAKAMRAAADSLPFPYVKVVFGSVVILLETVEVWVSFKVIEAP
jgi:hypothetical protein